MNRRLALVPPSRAEPVDVAAQWRAESARRDWAKVHIEGDRNPPISLSRRIWRFTLPTSRKDRSAR